MSILNSITICSEAATSLVGAGAVTMVTVDKNGNINKSGVTTVATTATTAINIASEYHEYNLINSKAYVDSLSDQELASLSEQLEQKGIELGLENNEVEQNNNSPKTM